MLVSEYLSSGRILSLILQTGKNPIGCVDEEVDVELELGCITGLTKRKGGAVLFRFCNSKRVLWIGLSPSVLSASGSSGLIQQPRENLGFWLSLVTGASLVGDTWDRGHYAGVAPPGKKSSQCIFLRELQVSLKITKTNPFSGNREAGEIWGSGENSESFGSCRVW